MQKHDEKILDSAVNGVYEMANMAPRDFLSNLIKRLGIIKDNSGFSNFIQTMSNTQELAYDELSFSICLKKIRENLKLMPKINAVALIKNKEFQKPQDFAEFKELIVATFINEKNEILYIIYFYHNKTDAVLKEKFGDKDMVILK